MNVPARTHVMKPLRAAPFAINQETRLFGRQRERGPAADGRVIYPNRSINENKVSTIDGWTDERGRCEPKRIRRTPRTRCAVSVQPRWQPVAGKVVNRCHFDAGVSSAAAFTLAGHLLRPIPVCACSRSYRLNDGGHRLMLQRGPFRPNVGSRLPIATGPKMRN